MKQTVWSHICTCFMTLRFWMPHNYWWTVHANVTSVFKLNTIILHGLQFSKHCIPLQLAKQTNTNSDGDDDGKWWRYAFPTWFGFRILTQTGHAHFGPHLDDWTTCKKLKFEWLIGIWMYLNTISEKQFTKNKTWNYFWQIHFQMLNGL